MNQFIPGDAMLTVVVCPSVCLSVCPTVRHKPVLCRNDWTNRAGFWHGGSLPSIPYCVLRKFGYVKKRGYFLLGLCPIALSTRSSATADEPRDAMCQLLHNSLGTTCTTNPEQIEVMELVGCSLPTYNKLVNSAATRSDVLGVIHKLAVDEFVDHTNKPTTCCGEIF